MTRNPPNRISGLGFTTKADQEQLAAYHRAMLEWHRDGMFSPPVIVSFNEYDHLFRDTQ